MDNNKILFIAQEIAPYLPETNLSVISRNIPQSIIERGFEVRTFMPKYGNINERRNQLHEVIRLSGLNIVIDDTDHQLIIKVATLQPSRMQVYFIDNDDYFQHHAVKDIELRQIPADNDERIIFFARGVIETVKKLRWEPAVIHNVGWIGALAPLYLKTAYNDDPSFRSSKVVVSLVDDAFQGALNARFIEKLRMDGVPEECLAQIADPQKIDYNALMRLAINHCDGVVITSDNVDQSLVEYAESLGRSVLNMPADPAGSNSSEVAQAYIDFYNTL